MREERITFAKIMNHIKESEKDYLIRTTGSIKGKTAEKDVAGQNYLYKREGMESEVIEVRLIDNISGSMLNEALQLTITRYPYLLTKLVEKDGDFYMIRNDIGLFARKSRRLEKLGSIRCNYHLVDVTYEKNSVFISFHHALCDGRGIKPFIETLLYYYCHFRYKINTPAEGIRLANTPLLKGETDDPFMNEYDYDRTKMFKEKNREAFPLPENENTFLSDYRYEMNMDHDQFLSKSREIGASPAIMLALLMNKAIAELNPDYEKPIRANIAMDMRNILGFPNTFKNCVRTISLPYNKEFASRSKEDQVKEYRKILKEERDPDLTKKEANAIIGLFKKLDELKGYEEKKRIMDFFETMRLDTYIISYLGTFILDGYEQYIDSIHLYNSGASGLGINMIATGTKFTLDFKQSFPSSKYVRAFAKELEIMGIDYDLSERIDFTTPKDGIIKRI